MMYRQYVLAELRCAALRARLAQADIDAVGVALKDGSISADQAIEILGDCDCLQYIEPTPPAQKANENNGHVTRDADIDPIEEFEKAKQNQRARDYHADVDNVEEFDAGALKGAKAKHASPRSTGAP